MNGTNSTQGCLQFTILGIPTEIHPSAWLVLLILGSSTDQNGMPDLTSTIIFVIAGMLCIIVHEYGHALMNRFMGGGPSEIKIYSLGGMTRSAYLPPTRTGHLLMVLAGPGICLLLAAVAGIVLGIILGSPRAGLELGLLGPLLSILPDQLMPQEGMYMLYSALQNGDVSRLTISCYSTLFFVCVWWSLLNLLPILPLDGGQALRIWTGNQKLTLHVSIIVGVLLLTVCIVKVMIFSGLICAWLIYQNRQWLMRER